MKQLDEMIRSVAGGWTRVELMAAVAALGVVAAIGVLGFCAAVHADRIDMERHEQVTAYATPGEDRFSLVASRLSTAPHTGQLRLRALIDSNLDVAQTTAERLEYDAFGAHTLCESARRVNSGINVDLPLKPVATRLTCF